LEITYNPKVGKLAGAKEVRITLQPVNREVVIQLQFE